MNRSETAKILDALQVAYPHAFKGQSKEMVLRLWSKLFAEETYKEVSVAVYAIIATRVEGYSPTIGEVKEKIRELRSANELSENEAWALVTKACSNGYYGYKKEFERLPPTVQKAVGRPEQLKEWSMMNVETFQSVVASNFMRSYRTISEREKEMSMLPPDVRKMIGGIADTLRLEPVHKEEQ